MKKNYMKSRKLERLLIKGREIFLSQLIEKKRNNKNRNGTEKITE